MYLNKEIVIYWVFNIVLGVGGKKKKINFLGIYYILGKEGSIWVDRIWICFDIMKLN